MDIRQMFDCVRRAKGPPLHLRWILPPFLSSLTAVRSTCFDIWASPHWCAHHPLPLLMQSNICLMSIKPIMNSLGDPWSCLLVVLLNDPWGGCPLLLICVSPSGTYQSEDNSPVSIKCQRSIKVLQTLTSFFLLAMLSHISIQCACILLGICPPLSYIT